jgi:beta-N-acetylhexosaminidase
MLKQLLPKQLKHIDHLLNTMTLEEKIGQTLCPDAWRFGVVANGKTVGGFIDEAIRKIESYHLGCFFLPYGASAAFKKFEKIIQKHARIPLIVNADLETGAGCRITDRTSFPWTMAGGAANSVELIQTMGEATRVEGRACGVHWTLGPLVDLCLNHNNPMVFGRSFGCKPEHVARLSSAFIRAVQTDGQMAATAKHFPGDGYDDREPHMCTSILSMTRRQWMNSYGVTWKSAIDAGVMSIMTAHIGLPFVDPGDTYAGPPPATLSRKQIDFLREELHFQGLIIIDAMRMIGFASHAAPADRAWRAVAAGNDVVLFSRPAIDFPNMIRAVRKGWLSEDRVEQAARRVLELKTRVGLFDNLTVKDPSPQTVLRYKAAAEEIARRSICIVRNEKKDEKTDKVLPLSLKKGSRVLTITNAFVTGVRHNAGEDLSVVDRELRRRGLLVDHRVNAEIVELQKILHKYEVIFMNFNVPPRYGTTRLQFPAANALWDCVWAGHPRVVFTSFGNPFAIYELPYAPNMVLTFSNTDSSQAAAVKVWLGEEKAMGKCPVELPGYLQCQV